MLGRSLKVTFVLMLLAALAAAQTIPSGTRITVRMGSSVSSASAAAGQKFDGTLASSLVVNGKRWPKQERRCEERLPMRSRAAACMPRES